MPEHDTHREATEMVDRLLRDQVLLYFTPDPAEQDLLSRRFYPLRDRVIDLVATALQEEPF